MKFFIGKVIGTIGAHLWKNGGWTDDSRYEDLKITGNIGFQMFLTGMKLMGITPDDLQKFITTS